MTTILRENFNSLSAWSNVSFQFVVIPGGRTSNGVQADAGGTATYNIPLAVQSDWFTIGFAVRLQPDMSYSHILAYLANDDGSNAYYQLGLQVSEAGALQVFNTNGGEIRATTATGVVALDTWTYVEFQIKMHLTAGEIKMRVNDVQLAAVTGVSTKSTNGNAAVSRVDMYGGQITGQLHFFDDLYMKTGAGETFLGDTAFGPEARIPRTSARVGFPQPPLVDWYRESRFSSRVGFSEPPTKDWYRSSRQSVRIAFQGANVAARLGAIEVRVLATPSGGNAIVGALSARVLMLPTGGNAVVGSVQARVLRPFIAPDIHFWDGSAYDLGPASTWDGAAFRPALAVRTWDGSTWVDQP